MKSIKYFSLFMLLSIATTALSMEIVEIKEGDYVNPNITVIHPTHVQEGQEKRKQPASDQKPSPRETKRKNTTQTNN